jgi:hypothetical protein
MRLVEALLPVPVIAASGVAINAIACGDAPQTFDGGTPLFDARYAPESDAGDAACIATDAAGATWAALYADMFGPASIGQCGDATRTGANGTTSCHHDSGGSGAQASGFVCGDTQQSCYDGLTSPSAQFAGEQVVVPCSPETSYLMQVLRHDGGGIMPFYPETAVFSDADMARIRAWIAAGAPNN